MNRDFARSLRHNMTDAERRLWQQLRQRQLQGCKFQRQGPIGPYIADFVCFEKRLIVELDGGQHGEEAAYDAQRTHWLANQGFTVLRFWNNDVFDSLDGVMEVIDRALSTPHPNPPPQGGREEHVS